MLGEEPWSSPRTAWPSWRCGDTIGHIDQTWIGSIEEALNAHFTQPDGTSRPGTHWRVDLTRGEQAYTTLVLTYRPDGIAPDVETQARVVLRYVFDRLAAGWTPEHGDLPPITLSANA